MSRTPPPVGPNLQQWAQSTRTWLQRWATNLQWKTSRDNPSENGILMWSEGDKYPVVSVDGEWTEVNIGGAMDFGIRLAEAEILGRYGDTVSVIDKAKTLLKFGRRDDLGTSFSTIWQTNGNETYATTNAIDTISSASAADAQAMTVEGHTVTGTGTSAEFTFVIQSATLNGQNKVVLSTPLARVSRVYVTGSSVLSGDVRVYEDTAISGGVPTDISKAHITVLAGETQSFKAATAFSNLDYFILTSMFVAVDKKTTASVDFEMQVRTPGGVFRPISRVALNSSAQTTQQIEFYPYKIIRKNSDIRVVAISSNTNTAVSASFMGFLAGVQA